MRETFTLLEMIIEDWLSILSDCEFDLQEYGRWETMRFQGACRDLGVEKSKWYDRTTQEWVDPGSTWPFRFIGFSFRKRIDDWKFWFSEPTDQFAGDFWQLIDEGKRQESNVEGFDEPSIPGAWSDDF